MADPDADDISQGTGQRGATTPGQGGAAPHPRHHALAMASADHLHRNGYISGDHRDKIHAHAKGKLAAHKKRKAEPLSEFGSLAPTTSGHHMSTMQRMGRPDERPL